MDEEELQSLVVRITGDASSYEQMLEDSEEATEETTESIEKNASKIESLAESIKGFARSAIEVVTGLGAKGLLEDFLENFSEAEEVDIALSAALKANGREVDSLMERYQEFATAIQRQTTLGDESVKTLLKQAETFGLTGKAAEKAAKDAISLAAVTSNSAQAMIRLTAALQKGDIETARRFGRLVPQLRGIKDNAEFVKKATDLMGQGWETATKKADTAHGRLKQLDEVIGDIKEDLGKIVADVIKPFIESLGDIARYIKEMPPTMKEGIVVALGLSVAIGLVTAAITAAAAAAALFDLSTGGLLLILGAIVTGIALTTGAIVSFAAASGGMAAAATKVKDELIKFWEWLKPVRQALYSLGTAIEEVFNQAVEAFKDAVVELWQSISEGADWNKVRDDAVRAILSIEFYIRNFKRTWDIVWFGAKIGMIAVMMEIEHFFSSTVPILLAYFGRNWSNIFIDISNFWSTVLKNMSTNAVNIFSNLDRLIAGTVKFDDLWKPLTKGFKSTIEEFPKIPRRVIGPIEANMRKLFGQMWDNLDADRKKFIEEKLKEFGLTPEVKKEAEDTGEELGKDLNKGIDKEIKKVDAAVFASAEALSRIAEYRERNARKVIEEPSPQKQGGGFGQRMFDALARQKQAQEIRTKDPEALEVLKRMAKGINVLEKNTYKMGFPLTPSSLSD